MENSVKMKCPECLNILNAIKHENGSISGKCPVCKIVFFSKQHSPKERLIRIIKKS